MLFGAKNGQNPSNLSATEQYLLFSTYLHLFRQFFTQMNPLTVKIRLLFNELTAVNGTDQHVSILSIAHLKRTI